MICIDVPEHLMEKITVFARLAEQTPEQVTLEMLEEWVDHQSAYIETHYLRRSARNRERLDEAIEDIRHGQFQMHALIDD
jgi:hypothetical protein